MADENQGEGSGTSAEVGSRDPGFAEFSEGYGPQAQPAEPEPAGSQPAPSGASVSATPPAAPGAPPTKPTGQPATAAAAEPRRWKVGGRDYTLEELAQAGLLDRVVTQAEQVAHYQKLYERSEQERERIAAQAEQARAAQQPQPPAGPTTEQLIANYAPVIQDAVKAGYLEEDVATFYPKTTARMLFLSDIVQNQGQLINELRGWFQTLAQHGQSAQVQTHLNSAADEAAKMGPLYADLSNAEARQPFFAWLSQKVNSPLGLVDPDYMASMWAGYKRADWTALATAASQAQRGIEEEKRRNAQGEAGGTRAPIAPDKSKKERDLEEMVEGFLPPLARV